MTISELISALTVVQQQFGDLPVCIYKQDSRQSLPVTGCIVDNDNLCLEAQDE